jgi:hypothetical protein
MIHRSNLLELIIESQNSSTKADKLFKSGGLKIDLLGKDFPVGASKRT